MCKKLNKTIKEFHIKQQKLLDEMTNYSKTQLISIIEREMNENHYLRNEIGQLRTELNTKDNIINELEEYLYKIDEDYESDNGYRVRETKAYLKELKEENNVQ